MAGIYIHIPFCRQACYYCDFHFSTNHSRLDAMIEAECREICLQKDYLEQEPISTIYFGGGTPSLLEKKNLAKIMVAIGESQEVKQDAEVTLEANPDDITDSILKDWKEVGINRLSVGVQSFDDQTLTFMNRVHDSNQALESINKAREHGFENVNIDLIYGISRPDHNRWIADLEILEQLRPEHLSAYCLTIEENTVFGKWLKNDRIKPVNDDFGASEFEILTNKLKSLGYIHYEVSNFCLPGKESKHNSGYWKSKKYLGIGPGAHSYNNEYRHYNISNNALYIKSLQNDKIPNRTEKLSREEKINEYLLTTLRTHWGASIGHLKHDYGFDILAERSKYLEGLQNQGYIEIKDDSILLTTAGFLLADKITSDLFI